MAESNIAIYEDSVQDGQPIECYKFTYQGVNYLYTSHCRDVEIIFPGGQSEKYIAEYIERPAIKPASKGDTDSMVIDVSKDHVIAKLWQGPPPETPVTVKIYRLHEQDHSKVDVVFYGRISQANFSEDSKCHLAAKLENWLSKEIPSGKRQYFCNNVIFDTKCRLVKADWLVDAVVDQVTGLYVYSPKFAEYPDDYFTGGSFYYAGNVRMISEHEGDRVKLKYPFISAPRNDIQLTPGCNHLFRTCALKFQNTLNFNGFPYVAPTDPEKNPTGKGVYWIDSLVVQRDTNGFVGTIEL